jgi:MFS family permease
LKSSQLAVAGLALSMLLSSLGTSSANVALPTLADGFGAPLAAVKWVVVAYLLAITTSSVVAGRLGDRFGRRRLLLAGLGSFAAASVVAAVATSLAILVVARAAQGLGAALMMALSVAFVRETVPSSKIGSAMGLLGSTSAVGTALGPALGGLLIELFGWRALFLVNLPLSLLAAALVARYTPVDRPRSASARPEMVWSAELAAGLGASLRRDRLAPYRELLRLPEPERRQDLRRQQRRDAPRADAHAVPRHPPPGAGHRSQRLRGVRVRRVWADDR